MRYVIHHRQEMAMVAVDVPDGGLQSRDFIVVGQLASAWISSRNFRRLELPRFSMPERFPHRRLDRQIERIIQRLFTKATR